MIPREQIRSIYFAILPAFILIISFREAFRFAGAVTIFYLIGAFLMRLFLREVSYSALQRGVLVYVVLSSLLANYFFHVSPILFVSLWALFFEIEHKSSFDLYGIPKEGRKTKPQAYRLSTITTTSTAFLCLYLMLVITTHLFQTSWLGIFSQNQTQENVLWRAPILAVFYLSQFLIFEVVIQFWNQSHPVKTQEVE